MKHTLIAGIILCALPAAHAQKQQAEAVSAVEAPAAVSGTFSAAARSSYLWNGLSFSDRGVFQWELALEFASVPGLSVAFWGSNGFDRDFSGDYDDEIDLTVGYSLNLSKSVTLEVRAAYYDEPDLISFGLGDVFTTGVRLNWQIAESLAGYVDAGHYWTRGAGGLDGWVFEAGVEASRWGVDWGLGLIVDDGPFGFTSGTALKVSAAKTWKLSGRWSLTLPEVVAFLPLRGKNDRDLCAAVGCGLTVTF